MRINFGIAAFLMLFMCAGASAQTFCTTITNSSTGEQFAFQLGAAKYAVAQNFITPSYAGLTIDNSSYTLYPQVAKAINQNTAAYAEIMQINYVPIQPSINFIICSAAQGPDTQYSFNLSANSYGEPYFGYSNTTLSINSGAMGYFPTQVTVTDANGSTPSAPQGYSKLALGIDIATNTSETASITQGVPCYVTKSKLYAEYILNGAWAQITPVELNPNACTVSFNLPNYKQMAIGIFYSGVQVSTASSSSSSSSSPTTQSTSTSSAYTTSISTTTTIKTMQSTSSSSTTAPATTTVQSTAATSSVDPKATIPASAASGTWLVNYLTYSPWTLPAIAAALTLSVAAAVCIIIARRRRSRKLRRFGGRKKH